MPYILDDSSPRQTGTETQHSSFLKTPDCTSQCLYTGCTHQRNFMNSFKVPGESNADDLLSNRTSQLHLSPGNTIRTSSNRSRSPSGFSSLRRTLSGRSQNGSDGRQGRTSIFSSLFPSRSQRPESPPPPYSPSVGNESIPSGNTGNTGTTTTVADDQYAFLKEFNTIFLIDDSLSMKAENRWSETQKAISAILPICMEHDEDGIDVYFLNHRTDDRGEASRGAVGSGYRGVRDVRVVQNMFKFVKPSLATPTGLRLDHILRAYLRNYEALVRRTGDVYCVRPINVIVITDGQPTDEPGEIIAQAARRLDDLQAPPHQIGIQFFQVGRDPSATQALRELDDELCRRESIRDMVDTATFNGANKADQPTLTADGILKVVLGAVKRKLDRKVLVRIDGPPR
ncbi:hypothetical protein K449DRAFT_392542 [Hypoxylon sp. EC38]|nr:hypothetical protein K449DRAFT_392542 [Hypoxylon sp. EC38]